MKKNNFLLLLLMALTIMSCSKDETTMNMPQTNTPIEFGTYLGRDVQTRAPIASNIMNDDALKESGFGVFAYYRESNDYAGNSSPNFMYNQYVYYDAGTSSWGYTPLKYWPNNDGHKISFFAYAPHSDGTQNNISAFAPATNSAGDPTLKFTVNGTVKNQKDLVWGVKASSGTPFLNQTKPTITGNTSFRFMHALARIGFNVQAMVDKVNDGSVTSEDIASATRVVVTKVELKGDFYESAILNLNNTAEATPRWGSYKPTTLAERSFSLVAGTDANESNFADAKLVGLVTGKETFGQDVSTVATKLNADDSYIMVIPQDFADTDKVKIVVTYYVITKDDSLPTGQSKVSNEITSDAFNFNFEHGKAYTFNLYIGMTSVKMAATVANWDETTPGTNVNVPTNAAITAMFTHVINASDGKVTVKNQSEGATSYEWDFGGAGSSSQVVTVSNKDDIVYTYNNGGTYTVKLSAKDANWVVKSVYEKQISIDVA